MAGQDLPARFILRVMRGDGEVRVEIEDNGPGMPEELRKRVFEPFSPPSGWVKAPGLAFRCPISW